MCVNVVPCILQEYPNIGHIKSLKMKKASISKRYGDPNNENVRKWYLEDGNTYPYPKCIQESRYSTIVA